MKTIKKKDIKNYKPKVAKKKKEEAEELDELVTDTGGKIHGDKNNGNSEVKTAPGATTDDFLNVAIQPNNPYYNINGAPYTRGGVTQQSETINRIAKEKMIKLLEDINPMTLDTDEKFVDANQNQVDDKKELPLNVVNKLEELIKTVKMNNLETNDIFMVLNEVITNLKPLMSEEDLNRLRRSI